MFLGYTVAQIAIAIVIIAAIIAVVSIALKKFNITIPDWVIQIFWILIVAIVVIFAIKILLSIW